MSELGDVNFGVKFSTAEFKGFGFFGSGLTGLRKGTLRQMSSDGLMFVVERFMAGGRDEDRKDLRIAYSLSCIVNLHVIVLIV